MTGKAERVLAAATEGQAQSLRYIQQQLSRLHTALADASSDLQKAIRKDTKYTTSEVEIQYALALENVATHLSESGFEAQLQSEYRLARSENAADNTAPYGTVYVVPASCNQFYSCVTAVAAAIVAGNCVILELPKTLSTSTKLVSKVLSNALSHDTFTIVDHVSKAEISSKPSIRLHGSPDASIAPSQRELAVPTTRSVAVVDRYADMSDAATSLLRARFGFGGQAPIAPQMVLVNEYRMKDFCNAIASQASRYFAHQLEMNGDSSHAAATEARVARTSSRELDQAGAGTIISGSKGSVVMVNDRKSSVLTKHINEPVLVLHPVTSIDDAIDFINSTTEGPLAALHVFGNPEVGKYASQFINSHLCCVNDIPIELLVAPLTPIGFATQPSKPYRKEMFSMPKPQLIQFGERHARLAAMLDSNDEKEAVKLRKQAQNIDTKVRQPAGHAIGFFEQGLMLGASVALTTIVSSAVVLFKYGIPAVRRGIGH